MKDYTVEIEFDSVEFQVRAKSKADARKKAMARLKKKSPTSFIKKQFPSGRAVWIDER